MHMLYHSEHVWERRKPWNIEQSIAISCQLSNMSLYRYKSVVQWKLWQSSLLFPTVEVGEISLHQLDILTTEYHLFNTVKPHNSGNSKNQFFLYCEEFLKRFPNSEDQIPVKWIDGINHVSVIWCEAPCIPLLVGSTVIGFECTLETSRINFWTNQICVNWTEYFSIEKSNGISGYEPFN